MLPQTVSEMPPKQRLLCSLSLLMTLAFAGCATQAPPAVTVLQPDNFCAIAGKITWSTADTRETITQVSRENAKHDRICGPKKPPPKTS